MKLCGGGRILERLAGPCTTGDRPRSPRHWRTIRAARDPGADDREVSDLRWLRSPSANVVRTGLQQAALFPLVRAIARPRVVGAAQLTHTPQPAVITPNHASDIDTPLILAALPYSWLSRTVVGAAADRFYGRAAVAAMTALWINSFPFDRGSDLRGLAAAAQLLRTGHNVLLYPQATRSVGQIDGFRSGVARLCLATGAPLVPVHVAGTALIMPRGRGSLQRGRATVAFGAPIFPLADEHPSELIDRTRAAIVALSETRRAR